MEFTQLIRKRRSVRAFKQADIDKSLILQICDDINQAPSAGNLQSYCVYIIKKKEIKERLAEAAYGQDFISDAPVVMVFCANRKRSSKKYGKRGENLYSLQDATIAATYAILSIENHGMSSVWVGAFNDTMVSDILGLESHLVPVAIIPFGLPDETPDFPGRRKIDEIFIELSDTSG